MTNTIKFFQVNGDALVGEVVALAETIWQEYYPSIIGQAQVEYMLEKFQSVRAVTEQIKEGYRYYLVFEDKTSPMGYFCVLPKDDELFLSKIYLKAEARGKGAGRETLNFIEKLAKENGCSKIWLTVNKNNSHSVKIYQKCGYMVVGPVLQDIGEGFTMDDYKLEKLVL